MEACCTWFTGAMALFCHYYRKDISEIPVPLWMNKPKSILLTEVLWWHEEVTHHYLNKRGRTFSSTTHRGGGGGGSRVDTGVLVFNDMHSSGILKMTSLSMAENKDKRNAPRRRQNTINLVENTSKTCKLRLKQRSNSKNEWNVSFRIHSDGSSPLQTNWVPASWSH